MSKIILITHEELSSLLDQKIKYYFDDLGEKIDKRINPKKEKLTVQEVAKKLNVTELTVRNYISKGFIKADKIGRRILIDSKELENTLSKVKSLKYRRDE